MSEYLTSLIAVCALISLCLAALYREEKEGAALKCAFAVLLLYISIVPLLGMIKDFDPNDLKFDTGAYYPTENDSADKTVEEGFCHGIKLLLTDEFELNTDDIDVILFGFDPMKMRAENIIIILKNDAVYADFRAIRARIEKCGLGSCEVKIAR